MKKFLNNLNKMFSVKNIEGVSTVKKIIVFLIGIILSAIGYYVVNYVDNPVIHFVILLLFLVIALSIKFNRKKKTDF